MKHVLALLIKLAFIEVITVAALAGLTPARVMDVLAVGLVITGALYLLGDLLILPTLGNAWAVAADAGVAGLLAWLAPTYTAIPTVSLTAALAVAVAVGIAEYYFHEYLKAKILPGPPAGSGPTH